MKSFRYYLAFCAALLLMVAASCARAAGCDGVYNGILIQDNAPGDPEPFNIFFGWLTAHSDDDGIFDFVFTGHAFSVRDENITAAQFGPWPECIFTIEYRYDPVFKGGFE